MVNGIAEEKKSRITFVKNNTGYIGRSSPLYRREIYRCNYIGRVIYR